MDGRLIAPCLQGKTPTVKGGDPIWKHELAFNATGLDSREDLKITIFADNPLWKVTAVLPCCCAATVPCWCRTTRWGRW